MALVYTALGVAAGLVGEGLAGALQNPWVLVIFGALLVVLSLSMFGVYELQLPAALRDRLTSRGNALRGGQLAGVFAMGAHLGADRRAPAWPRRWPARCSTSARRATSCSAAARCSRWPSA